MESCQTGFVNKTTIFGRFCSTGLPFYFSVWFAKRVFELFKIYRFFSLAEFGAYKISIDSCLIHMYIYTHISVLHND